jgi:hypothetical protein
MISPENMAQSYNSERWRIRNLPIPESGISAKTNHGEEIHSAVQFSVIRSDKDRDDKIW